MLKTARWAKKALFFCALPLALSACIDEQYQKNRSTEELNMQKAEEEAQKKPSDEDVQALNEELEKKEEAPKGAESEIVEENLNPELSLEEVVFNAIQSNNFEKLKTVLELGLIKDVNLRNAKDPLKKTLLIEAVRLGRIAMVQFLLSRGADASLPDSEGRTALDWAAQANNIVITQLLAGQDLNHDVLKQTLLEICKVIGHVEEIAFILQEGVDPNFTANGSISPIYESARSGLMLNVLALLDHGANINFHEKGRTALIGAIDAADIDIVKLLLERGADPRIPYEGRGGKETLPIDYAKKNMENGSVEQNTVVDLLEAAMK